MDIEKYCKHTIDIAQYCPQNIRWISLNTVHRMFNRYCSILSTDNSMFLKLHNKKQLHLIDTIYCAQLQYQKQTVNNTVQ